jgi:hypothetical protein
MQTLIHVPFFPAAFEEDPSGQRPREAPGARDEQFGLGGSSLPPPRPRKARPGFLIALLRSLAAWAC